MSAYFSKIACNLGDLDDHKGAINQLKKQAPLASRFLSNLSHPGNKPVPCLTLLEFTSLLREAMGTEARWHINAHFKTQADHCAFTQVGYDHLIPLEDNAAGMKDILSHLGLPGPKLGTRHHNIKKPGSRLPQ